MNPFHHHHHHHAPDDDAGDDRRNHLYPPPGLRPPPPPFFPSAPGPEPYGRPPFPPFPSYPPPPPPSDVHHVSHERGYGFDPYPPAPGYHGDAGESHHHHHHHDSHGYPEFPHHGPPGSAVVEHVRHESDERPRPRQQTFRVYCKANESFSLSIRNGQVILARNDPSDEFQHWIKDMTYSTKVKDEEGFPAFSLINKVTGEAIKHSIGQGHPVRLIKYNPDYLDESILWAESKDVGHGFRCIRMVNNIHLNFDAFHGDKDHGGVKDGTTVALWEWWKGDNQKWKIVPQ